VSVLKKLAGQTAIYGLSSIVGRALNFLMVPIYTKVLLPADYGIVSELYAYVAFFIVILTFGMETTFFRFLNQEKETNKVFSNAFITLAGINIMFLIGVIVFLNPIASLMIYQNHTEYILILALILSIDAITSLPLARLRAEEKAKKFATVQLASIFVNIGLTLFFLLILFDKNTDDASTGVLYIFIANLVASLVKPILLWKEFLTIRFEWDYVLMKKMWKYALPIVIAGFAWIINETFDRILIKQLLNNPEIIPQDFIGTPLRYAESQVGIYSANYKLATFITIFLQAFRYASEPFFFAQAKKDPERKVYGQIMSYLVAALAFCFLLVSLNIELFKYFISTEAYWSGLQIVPILLIANIFSGIYMSQSIWYKLSGQTKFGAYISITGASITLLLLFTLIPIYGYIAAAWTTLIVYGLQMVASYLLGQKYYPIPYNIKKTALYFFIALSLFFIAYIIKLEFGIIQFIVHNSLILLFLLFVWLKEKKQIN
jgi:O-antigen/teichoic acid export membrane protein